MNTTLLKKPNIHSNEDLFLDLPNRPISPNEDYQFSMDYSRRTSKDHISFDLGEALGTEIKGELYCPIETGINRYYYQAKEHCFRWAVEMGLVNTENEKSVRKFIDSDYGKLCAYCYPDVNEESLKLITEWVTFLFPHDDEVDTTISEVGKNEKEINNVNLHLAHVLLGKEDHRESLALSKAAHDIRNKIIHPVFNSEAFFKQVKNYIKHTDIEAKFRNGKLKATVEKYMKIRPFTGAVYTVLDAGATYGKYTLSPEERNNTIFKELALLTNLHVCFVNDIFSLKKELNEGSLNVIMIKKNEANSSLQEALGFVIAASNAVMFRFKNLENKLIEDYSISENMSLYIKMLKSWIRGNIDWSLETARYNI